MLVGIDIYHKLVKKTQSCMGIVCSLDQNFTNYYSRILIMKRDQKMAQNIAEIIKDGIIAYFEYNKKTLPDHIIVYRVGVGDSQIEALQ